MQYGTRTNAWRTAIQEWPDSDRDWAESYVRAMLLAGAAEPDVVAALATSLEAVHASGERPAALFGSPGAYGRASGLRLVPAPARLERELAFSSLPLLTAATLISVGGALVALGVVLAFSGGWSATTFQGKAILLFPLVGAVVAAAAWGWTVRTRGRLRLAAGLWICAGVLAAVLPHVMMTLPDMTELAIPNWAVVLLGAALLGTAAALPRNKPRDLVNDTAWGGEQWFSHAQSLLRGRYLFSRNQARNAVREARAHLALDGARQSTPTQEFGNVEVFAAGLAADAEHSAQRLVMARRIGFVLAAAALWVLAGIGIVQNEPWWWGVGWVLMGTWCLTKGLTPSPAKEARRLQRRRRADLLAMTADPLD